MTIEQFLKRLQARPLIFDGAMGTNIQRLELSPDDFGGHPGCNEALVLYKPQAIQQIHASFLEVGVDVVETDTFGANRVVLSEYGLEDKTYEINRTAAVIARETASAFEPQRYVAGSVGPGTKLPSLGHITYGELKQAYEPQIEGLLDGGVDLLIVETVQDPLQAKAALNAVFDTFRRKKQRVPVLVSLTVEQTGTMLLGTETAAALAVVEPFPVQGVGLNCAVGPQAMEPHVKTLARLSPFPISVIPNAGLPRTVGGKMVYDLAPEGLAQNLERFVREEGVNIVGGCCGTTPEHLQRVVEAVREIEPRQRQPRYRAAGASLFSRVSFQQEPKPLLIGERTNANGSRRFRELLLQEDWDGMVELAREQAAEGAHMLDVSVAYVGRDEVADMRHFIQHLNPVCPIPVMIDSTNPAAIRVALENLSGRAVVNSINLENGPEKAREIIALCREFGAGLVALTIDEEGMALTVERKLAVAERLVELAVTEGGLRLEDLFIDPLTFTLASGDEEYRRSALETLAAVKALKEKFPGAQVSLGVSNVSFGLKPTARKVLNSVFLHRAVEAGLDAAIVHAGKLVPYPQISEQERRLMNDLIDDNRRPDYDPLQEILRFYAGRKGAARKTVLTELPLEERLRQHIIQGRKTGLETTLEAALERYSPLEIINDHLLEGMKVVGERFGKGELQLPFVLQSAETMKAAVRYLEPRMEKKDVAPRGTMVIATVQGDVHDIGKNLVDIILSNNGYRVVNLGIKVPVETIIRKFQEEKADAIGMSGLLVKSTVVMKENLEYMNRLGITPPTILGGAALTRSYVEKELRPVFKGPLMYAKDAFDGLSFMEKVATGVLDAPPERGVTSRPAPTPIFSKEEKKKELSRVEVPVPPFWGRKGPVELPLEEVWVWLNETALVRGRWGFHKGKMKPEEYARLERERIRPALERLKAESRREGWLTPVGVYGYFSCRAEGEKLLVYRQPTDREPLVVWTFPRQKKAPYRCLTDYFRTTADEEPDVVALMAVTVGPRATERAQELYARDDYQEYLFFHGLAVETAEAAAEFLHARIRREWGIADQDATELKAIFKKGYRGCRYSFGYPACPDLQQQEGLFQLLQPEDIGLSLTEGWQLVPEQSVTALIVHHPEAGYFNT